jgi:hypothetical protein
MIVSHVFRPSPAGGVTNETRGCKGGTNVPLGMCNWLGTCGRPQDDHITVWDFRARRGVR